jgi:hypothetical protein
MKSAWVWIGLISGLAVGACAGFLAGSAQSPARPAEAVRPTAPNAAAGQALDRPEEAQRVVVELSALRAELRALREDFLTSTADARQAAQLKEPQPGLASEPPRREVPPPVPVELQDLALQVEVLQAAVDGLTQALEELTEAEWPSAAPPTIAQIRAGKPYTDWAAVKAVHQAYNAAATDEGKQAVVEALKYMTYDEVLARFGRPSEIGAGWIRYGELLGLDFLSGYVVNAAIEEP